MKKNIKNKEFCAKTTEQFYNADIQILSVGCGLTSI